MKFARNTARIRTYRESVEDHDADPPGPAMTTDEAMTAYEQSARFAEDVLMWAFEALEADSLPDGVLAALAALYRGTPAYADIVAAIADGEVTA